LGTRQQFFAANPGTSEVIEFQADNTFRVYHYSGGFIYTVTTTQVFRDPSAWYHIVWQKDTTQATDSNRIKLYVNGVQITALNSPTYPALNSEYDVNNAVVHQVGSGGSGGLAFGGYMTEVNFIDGQALTPSSFGEYNADTGVWQPKRYAGSYGTNGFYLNFSNNSNTTAATLGADYSGNGNNWTPNNFSVSAGSGNDSLVDSPTSYGTDTGVGGTVRGNYCTWNPLKKGSNVTISNGNLDIALANNGVDGKSLGTIGMSSGKWYWEVTPTVTNTASLIGICTDAASVSTSAGYDATSWSYGSSNGNKYNNSSSSSYGATYAVNDVIGVAFDADTGALTFYKNGTSQGTAFTGLTSGPYFATFGNAGISSSANFGQRPFAYTAPSGFKALTTQNLPTPTIGATPATQAGKFFDTTTYTSNGTSQTITNSGFQPDFVWTKARSAISSNILVNSVVGASKYLRSNTTDSETTDANYLTSFNSSGFSVGSSNYGSGTTMVGWQWKANGAGVTNTAGSITSTVSANTTSGFSVVTYTGSGSAATVGHGLGAAPRMIIVKARNFARNWNVYHGSLGATQGINLNATAAATTDSGWWNNTAPTSSVFTAGSYSSEGTVTYVAYCFSEIPGYSKFGSYTGNGSSDGPFLYLGFTPKYILIKQSSSSGTNWRIITINTSYLSANTADAQYDNPPGPIRGMSNGVKIVGTGGDINGSGSTFIYAAFAAFPFKYALAQSA
jgi:hypothetical protein